MLGSGTGFFHLNSSFVYAPIFPPLIQSQYSTVAQRKRAGLIYIVLVPGGPRIETEQCYSSFCFFERSCHPAFIFAALQKRSFAAYSEAGQLISLFKTGQDILTTFLNSFLPRNLILPYSTLEGSTRQCYAQYLEVCNAYTQFEFQ
ncbi:hypothetical protein AC578_4936 [Pseudocercospora eumusae]|uniref:Uncharacterized protein n=1 Tax=Pseudocercospora eumusae TaxID=321146 RepID=A0A139HNW5_9PEZI|nr:hypothetical protein AC578_4936 [Pseudocercospora eumusae]